MSTDAAKEPGRASTRRGSSRWLALVLLSLLFGTLHFLNLTVEAPHADQGQYLRYAHNTLHKGVFSVSAKAEPLPQHRREPGYPAMLIAAMKLTPGPHRSPDNLLCIARGEDACVQPTARLKWINIAALMATAWLAFFLSLRYTDDERAAWVVFGLILSSGALAYWTARFFPTTFAALLILGLAALLRKISAEGLTPRWALLLGLSLSALIYFKAAFYYFALLLLPALGWWEARSGRPRKELVRNLVLYALVLAACIGPWKLRNHRTLDTWAFSGRAGLVLTIRANYNQMTAPDYRSAFRLYSPRAGGFDPASNPGAEGRLLGREGYRLEAYHHLDEVMEANGGSRVRANETLAGEAVRRLLGSPLDSLRGVLLFAWRGSFAERGVGFPVAPENRFLEQSAPRIGDAHGIRLPFLRLDLLWSLLLTGSLFGLTYRCFRGREVQWLWFLSPALFWFALCATTTDFVPRYAAPLLPIYFMCLVELTRRWDLQRRGRRDT